MCLVSIYQFLVILGIFNVSVSESESLEGVFRGGLINHGKNVKKDSIHCINCQSHQSFQEPDK